MVNLELWDNICLKYKEEIGEQLYEFLLSGAKPFVLSNNEAIIVVDDFTKRFFEKDSDNYKIFSNAFSSITYTDSFSLDFITDKEILNYANKSNDKKHSFHIDKNILDDVSDDVEEPIEETNLYVQQNQETSNNYSKTRLQSNQKFKNFFYSYENTMVINAAKLVIDTIDNLEVNPLFLYGQSGLGKTHILNAIGNEIYEQHPNKNILYIKSTDFLEEYTDLFKGSLDNTKKIDDFKNKYASIDVLLIDDIQQLETKEASLNEFFNIFEKMRNNNKLIVIASDKHPKKIHFEERLITRFLSGVNVEIRLPDTDTKKQIFSYYAMQRDINIQEDAIGIFIDNSSTIRELLGYINAITVAFISNETDSLNINKEDAKKIVTKANGKPFSITEEDIIKIITDYFKVSKKDILSDKRTKNIVNARHFIAYFLRKKLNYKHVKIAYTLGFKDHTAALNSIKTAEKKSKDEKYEEDFKKISQLINN